MDFHTKKFNIKLLKRDDAMVGQGWLSGENTRPPPMWPGFKSRRRRHMWVEFVVGSLRYRVAPRDFSNVSFSLFSKTNTCKFQFDQVDQEPARGIATSKSLFIIYSLFKWK